MNAIYWYDRVHITAHNNKRYPTIIRNTGTVHSYLNCFHIIIFFSYFVPHLANPCFVLVVSYKLTWYSLMCQQCFEFLLLSLLSFFLIQHKLWIFLTKLYTNEVNCQQWISNDLKQTAFAIWTFTFWQK